jgi:hypothetical protein
MLNKVTNTCVLNWFRELCIKDRLRIILDNYGDQKIIDMKDDASDRGLLLIVSNTNEYCTDEYYQHEEMAKMNPPQHEAEMVNIYNYHDLYALNELHSLLRLLPNIDSRGDLQIDFVNRVAFATDGGRISVFGYHADLQKHFVDFKIDTSNDVFDPELEAKYLGFKGPFIRFLDKNEAINNYNITFRDYIEALSKVSFEKKLLGPW